MPADAIDILDYIRTNQTQFMIFLEGICAIIAFLTLITKNLSTTRKAVIFLIEFNALLNICAACLYYLWKDVATPDMWYLVRTTKFLDYLFILTIILWMNFYLKDLFTHEGELDRFPRRLFAVDIILILGIIVLVVSQFTDLYYYWDADNVYHRSPLVFINYIFPIAALAIMLSALLKFYKRFTPGVKLPLILFMFIPIIMGALQSATGGIALGAMSEVGMAIVLYVFTIKEMNKAVERAHRLEIEIMSKYQKELEDTVAERTKELRVANEKAEHLLLNILPENIARELTENPDKTISKRYPNSTVLFTDIVDFTKMSSNMSAEELVTMLNAMTMLFDARAAKEGIEKIKTIGDAYMAATGLTENEENDGAEKMLRFARGILTDVDEFNKTAEHPIQLRIGMNSGELVAGVIGKMKFIYDIWGDTVNVASRMESTGRAMRIHVSESTYRQIKDQVETGEEAKVDVKGKGVMNSYFIL